MFDISKYSISSSARLLNLFREGFNVIDLAQPLLSVEASSSRADARALIEHENLPCLGIRRNGRISGYVLPEDVSADGDLQEITNFQPDQIFDDSANLHELFEPLSKHSLVFVKVLGEVACVITRNDLEKPPMRMWLFGIITLLEINTTWAVEQLYPKNAWIKMISDARLEKAKIMQAERTRRNQPAELLSCLQFSDKLGILLKEKHHREVLQIDSLRKVKNTLKKLESIRNNLAHSQPIVEDNWETIKTLSSQLEIIVNAPRFRKLVDEFKPEVTTDNHTGEKSVCCFEI